MDIQGIFYNNHTDDYYWLDCLDVDDMKRAVYFCDADAGACHTCLKSTLYDDMTGYQDKMQHEDELPDDELYVVTYFKFFSDLRCLEQLVDFAITKQEIIDNVKAQKYVEGANYFTIGQVLHTTRKMLKETQVLKAHFK